MNSGSNSSSSSDELFDDMIMNCIVLNESLEQEEDLIIEKAVQSHVHPLVTSTIQRPPNYNLEEKKRCWIEREREFAAERLMNDYFDNRPLYTKAIFCRRFRMRKNVFLHILNTLTTKDPFFQQRPDATVRLGATPYQKCTTTIRMLAYGTIVDDFDEYLKIAESTTRECISHFVEGVIQEFGKEYLKRPTVSYFQRLLRVGESSGFPCMMGNIDCMHWKWKNCPHAWKGLYQGRNKSATIILEVVSSKDLWIWHAFFGTPGSCNDINVLQWSPVFDDIYHGRAPQVTYNVNGNTYNMGYYLINGIYPKWASFMPAIKLPQTLEDALFTRRQEAVKKDVERAFGVLQARFAIIQQPALRGMRTCCGR